MAKRTIFPNAGSDPIQKGMRIVNEDGTPTDAFLLNWLRQRENNSGLNTDATALAAKIIPVTAPITGGGPLGGTITPIGLANSGVTPGAYTSANITVDAFGRVTVAANGGGAGTKAFSGATGAPTTTGGVAAATKGAVFIPSANLTVTHLTVLVDPTAIGNTLVGRIASLVTAAGGVINAVLGSSAAIVATTTDAERFRFDFSGAPLSLTAGTPYLLAVSLTSGVGTTSVPIQQTTAAANTIWYLNAPGDTPRNFHNYNTITLAAAQAPLSSITTVWGCASLEGTF